MKVYVTFTKSRIIAFIAFFIIIAAVAFQTTANSGAVTLKTNNDRINFIENLGVKVQNTPETKEIVIPYEFSDVYENYNALQKEAGYDLSLYRGKRAIIYSYSGLDGEYKVNLIICDDVIIGGDISQIAIGGSMRALRK